MYKYFLIKIYLKDFPFIIIIIQYFKKRKEVKLQLRLYYIMLYFVRPLYQFLIIFQDHTV